MKVAGLIFSGMYNDGLENLTRHRTIASLPFAGRYRQIDFILSDMVNSEIYDIGVITKSNYQSLIDHLGSCQDWDLNRKRGGLIIIPPFATGASGGYRGKMEELRNALWFIAQKDAEYIVLSDSDIICNIDFRKVIDDHAASGRDMTVIASRAKENEGSTSELVFDSPDGETIDGIYLNYPARAGQYASLGMYVVRKDYLVESINALAAKGYYHMERDFIQQGFNRGMLNVGIYEFGGAVLKNRSIQDYYNNSLMMKDEKIRSEIFCPSAPIYTTVRDEVPTHYGEESSVSDCLLADGCKIEGKVENSVLFRGVKIGKGAVVRNSVVMAGCVIHDGAVVENAIIDKGASVSGLRHIVGAPQSPIIIQKGEII